MTHHLDLLKKFYSKGIELDYFDLASKFILSGLIIVILAAMAMGVFYTAIDLKLLYEQSFYKAFKTIFVDILTILALVEAYRTVLAYFKEGRVKVRMIIDVVLVTVLTELMAFWYKDMGWERVTMTIVLIVTLSILRIVAAKYSSLMIETKTGNGH
jgi:uncharacterized membrane protein (DUF373 family)